MLKQILVATLAVTAITATACVKTPITGRKAFVLLPLETEMALGEDAYKETLKTEKVTNHPATNHSVKTVGLRVAEVAKRRDWKWEFKVIDSPDVPNAFALPGGKVAVYSGILPLCKNEAGLAAVMGHEVAHATARHGGQRVSQSILVEMGLAVAEVSLEDNKQKDAIMAGLGAGAVVGVVLPFSRKMEAEADQIGLVYMARAGYDPREALRFWERFRDETKGQEPPEFLSTHPATESRIEAIRKALPKAMKEYRKAKKKLGAGKALPTP